MLDTCAAQLRVSHVGDLGQQQYAGQGTNTQAIVNVSTRNITELTECQKDFKVALKLVHECFLSSHESHFQ